MASQGCACRRLSGTYFYLVVSTCLQDPVQLVLDLCSHHLQTRRGCRIFCKGLVPTASSERCCSLHTHASMLGHGSWALSFC